MDLDSRHRVSPVVARGLEIPDAMNAGVDQDDRIFIDTTVPVARWPRNGLTQLIVELAADIVARGKAHPEGTL